MTAPGCPFPASCLVPGPSEVDLRHLRTVGLGAGPGYSTLFADLLPGRPEEVFVLFGDKLKTIDPNHYSAELPYDDLSSTAALPLVATIAEQVGATLA